jgi:hypothetical protein
VSDFHDALSTLNAVVNAIRELDVVGIVDREDEIRRTCPSERHKVACKENVFGYFVAIPAFHRVLSEWFGGDPGRAISSLKGEYHKKFPEFLSGNPFEESGRLFPKDLGAKPNKVYENWIRRSSRYPLFQAYPDLAIVEPFPTSVVIDFKYYSGTEGNSEPAAIAALVQSIYEIEHYTYATDKDDGRLRYRFGCLLAYDATPEKSLLQAYEAIPKANRFPNVGRTFVQIL